MNKARKFVSQVVDEIERRKNLDRLRDSLSWAAHWLEEDGKARKCVQKKLDDLNNISSWWNRCVLSKRIKRYEKEIERLNSNILHTTEYMDILLKHYKRLKEDDTTK